MKLQLWLLPHEVSLLVHVLKHVDYQMSVNIGDTQAAKKTGCKYTSEQINLMLARLNAKP